MVAWYCRSKKTNDRITKRDDANVRARDVQTQESLNNFDHKARLSRVGEGFRPRVLDLTAIIINESQSWKALYQRRTVLRCHACLEIVRIKQGAAEFRDPGMALIKRDGS